MWFLTYSMMGWLVESIYMSFCNHKITNRGFAKGPFCPIYGFGALTVFFVLRPYSDNSIRKREHYEKPSVRRKKKSEAARKRKYN